MVKTTADSFYKMTGLLPGVQYRVELINMAGQGALQVYSDQFATSICTSDRAGNFPEFCTVNSDGSGNIYFKGRDGVSFSSAGATYTIQIK